MVILSVVVTNAVLSVQDALNHMYKLLSHNYIILYYIVIYTITTTH